MGAKLLGNQRKQTFQMLAIVHYLAFVCSCSPPHPFYNLHLFKASPISAIPPNLLARHWSGINNISRIKNCKRNTKILMSRFLGVSIQYIKCERLTLSDKTMGNMRFRMQRHGASYPVHNTLERALNFPPSFPNLLPPTPTSRSQLFS